jgi:glycerol-3-phosphate dehydrogenase
MGCNRNGGGASGLGTALDAAKYKTILLEAIDFAKGTSSRSTKLAHGGVRYLEQRYFHGKGSFKRKRINGSKCHI